MKKITIDEKEFDIDCNAYTRFQYKSTFGKGIFADIKVLSDYSEKQNNLRKKLEKEGKTEEIIDKEISSIMLEDLDTFIDVIEKIAYILIYTANNKIGTFEDWLKSIGKISLSDSWIGEVTEFAVSSFCWQRDRRRI